MSHDKPELPEETPSRIIRRTVEPDPDDPYLAILEPIADLEDCAVEDLPPLYKYVDHLVENLFSTPPPEKAQAELTFTYYYYRVTVDQQGNMRLAKLAEPLEIH